jgi:hypothetical protein
LGREDRLVSEQLRTKRSSNPHTLFLCLLLKLKEHLSPLHIVLATFAKIAQFSKGKGKI